MCKIRLDVNSLSWTQCLWREDGDVGGDDDTVDGDDNDSNMTVMGMFNTMIMMTMMMMMMMIIYLHFYNAVEK